MNAFPKALDTLGNVKICGFFPQIFDLVCGFFPQIFDLVCGFFPQIFDLVCGFFPQIFDNFPVRCYSISENKRIETCVRS